MRRTSLSDSAVEDQTDPSATGIVPPGVLGCFLKTLLMLSIVSMAFPTLSIGKLPIYLILMMVSTIMEVISIRGRFVIPIPLMLALLVYLSFALLPAFFAGETRHLINLFIFFLLDLTALFTVFNVTKYSMKMRLWIMRSLSIAGAIPAATTLMYLTRNPRYGDLTKTLQLRGAGIAGLQSNFLASLLACSVVVTAGLTLWEKGTRRTLMYGVLGIELLALFFQLSRGASVATVIGLLVLAVASRCRGSLRPLLVLGGPILLLWVYYPDAGGLLLARFSRLGTLSGRTVLWGKALEAISTRPLFGVGMGRFQPEIEGTARLWLAHNIFLQQLLNAGVIGLLAYVFVWLIVVRTNLRALFNGGPQERVVCATIFAVMVTLWTHSLVEPVLGTPLMDMYGWIVAGLALSTPYIKGSMRT